MNDLAGQYALITGASLGLGARIAQKLWETGALGEQVFLRGRCGHGGRLGYEKE